MVAVGVWGRQLGSDVRVAPMFCTGELMDGTAEGLYCIDCIDCLIFYLEMSVSYIHDLAYR